ncbi:MAG: competence/damage-inducible protein A, partial [Alicyclobacillus sp. RIFOXYA1_FULL_53_8]
MMEICRAEHIAVGSEILLGQIANGHARSISLALAAEGFHLFHHSAVGDNMDRIVREFSQAAGRSNVVLVTGGLGPTGDDLTKEALAQFLGLPLEVSAEATIHLDRYFANRNKPMPEENRKQALCLQGGSILPNPNGTAPGQYITYAGVHYFLLPGPPLEMVPMLELEVLPRLRQIFGHQQVLVSRVLHFCGIGESEVDENVQDLTVAMNPTLAPLAGEGEMLLRITASAETDDEARTLIDPVERELRKRFGNFIYGMNEDTLPIAVGRVLSHLGASVSLAE